MAQEAIRVLRLRGNGEFNDVIMLLEMIGDSDV